MTRKHNDKHMEQMAQQEYKFLDTLDLSKYIIPHVSISDIIDGIEEDYAWAYKEQYNEELFNYLGTEEIIEYLERRFGFNFYEVTDYKVPYRQDLADKKAHKE